MRVQQSLLVFLVSCLVFCNFEFAEAKIQNGNLVSNSEWSFLGYFCYSNAGPGTLNFTGWSENDKGLVMAFYDDQEYSWPQVYPKRNELSCQELLNKSKSVLNIVTDQTTQIIFEDKIRPHYWYVAVANCGGKIDLQYKLEWLNYGGVWKRQLSFDEQGLAETYLFFWLLFLFATLVHIKGTWDLYRSGQFHPLLSASIILETWALMFLFTHYASYMQNGVGAPGAKGLGQVLDMLSQLTFMFLLILLAKGWAITRTEVTQQKVLTIAVSVFLLAYISMFVWESAGVDPAAGSYIYDSAPGVILLLLRSSALLWFGWCLRESYMEESDPVKKRFYQFFGTGYALWFFSLIFAVIIGAMFSVGGIPYRLKFLTGFYTTANTLAFFGLAFLLWPTRARDYFQITRQDILLGKNSSPYEAL